MDKYYFPLNYKYSSKFLGIIDYKILLPIVIYVSIIIFFLHLFEVDFFVGCGIVIVLALPPILLLSMGVNGQPVIPYVKAVIIFINSKKTYIYK